MKQANRLWTKNFILITLINLLIYCSFQMFPSSLPGYVESLGAPEKILGWVTGITTIATLLIRPISGVILDRFGRKGIFFLGMIVMLITTIAYLFLPFVGVILLLRFIHGIGWGVASTASNTIASDNILPSRFGEGMGYFSLSISLALAIAPALSLALDIQKVFLVSLLFLIAATVLLVFLPVRIVTPRQSSEPKGKISFYEKKSALPTIIIFLITTTYGGIVTFLFKFGNERGLASVGMFFTMYAIGMLITRPILGKILDKYGYAVVIWPSLLLVSVALILLANTHTLPMLIFSAVFYGIGYGSLQTCLQTMAVASAGTDRIGAANATYYTGFDGGIGFGSIISGLLVSITGYGGMFAFMAIFPILGAVIFFFYNRPVPKYKKT